MNIKEIKANIEGTARERAIYLDAAFNFDGKQYIS